ncbi:MULTISPECIES: tRNA (adenosine(37)-N6)-dimethylallyltransferase MiaA [Allobacillus]|uniref:tRNA dimethylallyltransferase n=1 Tax=Allobacillus salarius TaxID=1955272 RepID=A0A556PS59_9BACI|nr:tRNA (adenosine(37)-N6)-dimethylallyltransferase MiaA [Allobacillus salarius]TSJ67228.1 tRNA (adenosine(37)-N6)-dimethylallyltransferase MiaA [Allobacillus salarius]
MKQKIISVVGPTAVGKTKLGIEISKHIGGEVINGDSIQIYKEFDIGSAKATLEEREGIPHHLIDLLEPEDEYSASDFKQDVKEKVQEIHGKQKTPVLVGGTGFYVQAALYDFNFSSVKRDHQYSDRLLEQIEKDGIEPFYKRLQEVDPEQAKKIHPHNIRRVIRALEVYETTGKPLSIYEQEQIDTSYYDPYIIGLTMERSLLYERINQRVLDMIDQGLFEEIEQLYNRYGSDIQPMKGIGYKEVIPYLRGECGKAEAIELIQRNTRRFAKRQLTYFRNKLPAIHWYEITPQNAEENFKTILADLEGFLQNGENS